MTCDKLNFYNLAEIFIEMGWLLFKSNLLFIIITYNRK